MYKKKEKMKVYSYRQYPSVRARIEKVCKKYKIPTSEFTRIAEHTELLKAEKSYPQV